MYSSPQVPIVPLPVPTGLPDFIVLLYDHILVGRLVAGRVRVRIKAHVGGNRVAGDEAGQRTNLREQTHLVHLEKNNSSVEVNTSTTTNGVPGDEAGQRTNLREQTHLVHLEKNNSSVEVNTSTTTNGVPGDEAGQRTNLREQTHLVHLKKNNSSV
jgi:hypothetical protein